MCPRAPLPPFPRGDALPDGFKVSRLNTWLLWITVVTGFGGVGYWAWAVLPVEACKQAKLFSP